MKVVSIKKCPYCGKDIDMSSLDNIIDYALMLRECECGIVVNEQGEDVTDTYYRIKKLLTGKPEALELIWVPFSFAGGEEHET